MHFFYFIHQIPAKNQRNFLTNKTKTKNRINEKILQHKPCCKLGKLESNFKMNIMKMRKMLKSKKFMIIFAKIWTETRKLS